MTLTVWLSLLAATLIISLTPGAGAINTMSNSLRVGWRRSIWGVIGQQLALIVHVAIVAAKPFRRFAAGASGQRTLNTVFGVLFIAVAALLLFVH